MKKLILVALIVVAASGCGKRDPDVAGQWYGHFSAEAAKNDFSGHAPTVSLNLAANHTFELIVGTKTSGHWTLQDHGVHLKAEERNGKAIPPGGDGQEITLKLSEDATSMESTAQPITFKRT